VVDQWVASVLRLVELLPMHPALLFLRDHVDQAGLGALGEEDTQQQQQQPPAGQQQQQQATPRGASTGTGQQPVARPLQAHSRPRGPGVQQQVAGAQPPKDGLSKGPEEQLAVDVGGDGLRFGGRTQMQSAIMLAVGAGCVAVLAVVVVRHSQEDGSGGSALMSSIVGAISARARLGTRWER
jgi:hypothetical protein